MKAGIYMTPNGNLIYVAKDRTIRATNLDPSSWPGTKVSHREKDDTVVIQETNYRCLRVCDVPNGGIFNPQQTILDVRAKLHAGELDNPHESAAAWNAVAVTGDENVPAKEEPAFEVDTTLSPAPLAESAPAPTAPKALANAAYEAMKKIDGPHDFPEQFRAKYSSQLNQGERVADSNYNSFTGHALTPVDGERFVGKHPALGAGYGMGETATGRYHSGGVAGLREGDVPEILPAGTVIATDTIRSESLDGRGASAAPVIRETVVILPPDEQQRRLAEAMAARGFIFDEESDEFVGSSAKYYKLTEDVEDGKVADLDGLGPYTARMRTNKPDTGNVYGITHTTNELIDEMRGKVPQGSAHPPVIWPETTLIDNTLNTVDNAYRALKAGQFRLCHAAAARKHKKKRDRHVWWHPVFGCYAWRKTA